MQSFWSLGLAFNAQVANDFITDVLPASFSPTNVTIGDSLKLISTSPRFLKFLI